MEINTLEIKTLLNKIERYDSAMYNGEFYPRIKEAIDIAIAGCQLPRRIDEALNSLSIQEQSQYFLLCKLMTNNICAKHMEPVSAIAMLAEESYALN